MTEVTTDLYRGAQILGDVAGVERDPGAMAKRVERRWLGRLTR